MPTIHVKLSGAFSNRAASINRVSLPLSEKGEASVVVSAGKHKLRWSVEGEPGVPYSVELSGDTDEWPTDEEPTAFRMINGQDNGFKPFIAR